MPAKRAPRVLPMNAGMSRAPAAVLDAPCTTWKYKGTENMTLGKVSAKPNQKLSLDWKAYG